MVVATWNAACFHVPLPPSASTATSLAASSSSIPIFSAVVVVGRGEAILWCYSAPMADGSFRRHPSSEISQHISLKCSKIQMPPLGTAAISFS